MTRILLKLSGESLKTNIQTLGNYKELQHLEAQPCLPEGWGLADPRMLLKVALDVRQAQDEGIELGIVIGEAMSVVDHEMLLQDRNVWLRMESGCWQPSSMG